MPDPASLFDRAGGADDWPPAARSAWRDRIDEVLDATGVGWRRAIAGALAVGFALGAMWWLTRQAPAPVEAVLPMVEPASVTTTTTAPSPVVVHVAGAVVHPGVHELPPGARVIDAVEASGGLRADADAGRINLAAEVVDGSQVYVPAIGETPPVPIAPAGAAADDASGPIDVNVATAAQLEQLPGVGPATAAAIVEHRERNGPFTSVEGLLQVRGIGEAKLAQLRDLVRV